MQRPLVMKASLPAAKISAPILRAFLLFVAPILLSNLLLPLAGTVNSIYLGQMIGVRAFAAVSAFGPVQLFCLSFIMGLGTGATVLIGQAYSAGQKDRLMAVVGTALSVALLGGITAAVVGIFARPLMAALGTPSDVLADATDFARVLLFGQIVLFAFMLIAAMMRAVGDIMTPVFALMTSTVVAVVVGPVLIQGRAGFPALGVTGAACTIILAFAVALALLVFHLRRREHPLLPDARLLRRLRIDRTVFRTILFIAVSASAQLYASIIGLASLLAIANGYGSDGTAAYGAINQVMNYVQFPILSITIAATIISAQAIGAGRMGQLGGITATAVLMHLVMVGSLALLAYAFSRPIIGFFITSGPAIEQARSPLYLMLWGIIASGIGAVLSSVMRASGVVLVPTVITILALVILQVPLAYALNQSFGFDGIWMAFFLSWTVNTGLQAAYYLMVWRKRELRKLV
jgi:MATE family, multidrug efflux pump